MGVHSGLHLSLFILFNWCSSFCFFMCVWMTIEEAILQANCECTKEARARRTFSLSMLFLGGEAGAVEVEVGGRR